MSEKPLGHVVLCCTAISGHVRATILRQAHDMGATLQGALTCDVTHLIVGDVQSDKYKFAAKERLDLKLMGVEWVARLHERWISGQDVDVERLERLHQHKFLTGLRISSTNLESEMRSEVEKQIIQHGGIYTPDLTKENTHLIAGFASGRKYDAVRIWNSGIKVVGIEWLQGCVKRGAAVGEEYYALDIPSNERGKGAWQVAAPVSRSSSDSALLGAKRKADALETSSSTLKRRQSRRALQAADNGDGLWDQIFLNAPAVEQRTGEQDVSFDLPNTSTNMGAEADMSLLRTATEPVFSGCTFCIREFSDAKTRVVENVIQNEKGKVSATEESGCYMVVPQGHQPPQHGPGTTLVTEWWLERCLHSHKLLPPDEHFGAQPFKTTFPIPGMEKLSICTSGIEGVDLLHTEKLVKLTGARFTETLSRDCSVLIANSPSSRRCGGALKLGVRIVSQDWLHVIAERGKLIAMTGYALDGIESSRCRIDGQIVRSQKRSRALRDCRVFVCPDCAEHDPLTALVVSLGGEAVKSDCRSITHLVGDLEQLGKQERLVDEGRAIVVTPGWLKACDAASSRVAETDYRPVPNKKASPVKRDEKHEVGQRTTSSRTDLQEPLKLTTKLVSSNNAKRSRRLLGRAASAPDAFSEDGGASDGSLPGSSLLRARLASLPTAVREDAYAFDTAEARVIPQEDEDDGDIRYTDPETAAVHRSILARLEGRANEAGEPALARNASSLSTEHGGSLKGSASVASLLREDSSCGSHLTDARASTSGSGMTKAVGLGSRKTRGRTAAIKTALNR
jgi:DNA replication regulator DPB11